MDSKIDCDPHQYRDEWFDIAATVISREFELPNISNTYNHRMVDNSSNSATQTPAKTFDIDVACATGNQLVPVAVAKTPALVTNRQVCTSSPSAISSGHPLPICTSSDGFLSINVTADHLRHQKPHFKSIAKNPWTCCNDQKLRGSLNNGNVTSPGTTHVAIHANSGHGWSSSGQESTHHHGKRNSPSVKPKEEASEHGESNSCCLHNHARELGWSKSKIEAESHPEGDHKCFVCNVKFASGNALGGHMSAHAKKRKMEVLRNGGLSIFKADGPFILGLYHKDPKGSENVSNESAIVVTSVASMASTTAEEERVERSEASNDDQDHEGSCKSKTEVYEDRSSSSSQSKFARHTEDDWLITLSG